MCRRRECGKDFLYYAGFVRNILWPGGRKSFARMGGLSEFFSNPVHMGEKFFVRHLGPCFRQPCPRSVQICHEIELFVFHVLIPP